MFFEREQYTTYAPGLQGRAGTFSRNRQKTGRSALLPVAFVQFYGPASGCVSQSSAPRRKNSAAVAARPPYSRGNITPDAGRTTLASRVARHRPNSAQTSGCTQGAPRRGSFPACAAAPCAPSFPAHFYGYQKFPNIQNIIPCLSPLFNRDSCHFLGGSVCFV